jgi:hypothetical protein
MNKYAMLDRAYGPGDLEPPSEERVAAVVRRQNRERMRTRRGVYG